MGKDASAKLPKFSDGRHYLISGKTLNLIMDEVRRNRPIPGLGTTIRETADGRQVNAQELELPKHPWQLNPSATGGWSVWPARVNLTIEPVIGGVSLYAVPPPALFPDAGGNLDAWLSFDLTASSAQGPGGLYYLVSGSQVLSNVEVGNASTGETQVSVDQGSGSVTPGHYSVHIGTVTGGKVTAQSLRFSVAFTVCSGGGITPTPYG